MQNHSAIELTAMLNDAQKEIKKLKKQNIKQKEFTDLICKICHEDKHDIIIKADAFGKDKILLIVDKVGHGHLGFGNESLFDQMLYYLKRFNNDE